jgi:uncharacterized membrane-anchored protein
MTWFAKSSWAGAMLSAVLLTAGLGWMVVDRVQLLRAGREIVLPVRPVDPRDLFKGDFARMGYDISRVDPKLMPKMPPGARRPVVYVTLEQDAGGAWKPVAVARELPTGLAANQVVLRGRAWRGSGNQIAYGLERYFVPEGQGGRIEDMARKSQLSAVVAVRPNGDAAIKGLVIEGKRVYEEPLL